MWFIGAFSFPSCWFLWAIFFVFLLCERFFSFFLVFVSVSSKICLQTTLNSISASLDPHGPASSTSGEAAPSTKSVSTSSSSFTSVLSSPSLVAMSAENLSQAISQGFQQSLPLLLAAFRENGAPNSSSSTSGNSHAASSAINVPWTHTSTSTGCRSSSLAGSVTAPSFLSTYSSISIPVVPHASQPPVPASSAPSLFDSPLAPTSNSPTLAPSVGKVFVVGPGYAPVLGRLVAKITSGAFVELADLLAENMRAQEA